MVFTTSLALVPLCLDMNFLFADNYIITTEVAAIAELIEGVSEKDTVDGASDTDCNGGVVLSNCHRSG